MKTVHDIIKRPIISEKSMILVEENKYVFEVAKGANKVEIKNAIETIFEVKVAKVNTLSPKPKKKRVGKHSGFKAELRKAIVTLKEGHKIAAFEV